MTFSTPTIEVLENCLNDQKIMPFDTLLPHSLKCVKDINDELSELLDDELKLKEIGEKGFEYIIKNHDWKKLSSQLIKKIDGMN